MNRFNSLVKIVFAVLLCIPTIMFSQNDIKSIAPDGGGEQIIQNSECIGAEERILIN